MQYRSKVMTMTTVFKIGDLVEYWGNPGLPSWDGLHGVIAEDNDHIRYPIVTRVRVVFVPKDAETLGFKVGSTVSLISTYLRPYIINENEVFIEGDDDDDCI